MIIFFDFDGTLIDSRERLYHLFQKLVPNSNLSFKEYWTLKRNKITNKDIIEKYFTNTDYSLFEKKWMKLIENKDILDFDIPYSEVTDFLFRLSQKDVEMHLVTARQFPSMVYYQLKNFGWSSIFKSVLVTEQIIGKDELIKPLLRQERTYLIGDTGKDIEVGKKLNLITVGVANGFLSKESIAKYKPDYILNKVTDFKI